MNKGVMCVLGLLSVACGDAAVVVPNDSGTTQEAAASFHVSGTVVDSSNAPWSGAKVQVCGAGVCNLGNVDQAGAFRVSVPPGAGYDVVARPAAGDPRGQSAGLDLVGDVNGDVAITAPIVIPNMGTKFALDADAGAQAAAVTSDLTLTAAASDLSFYGDAYLAGAAVPSASWPPFVIAGQTIVAMWALDPWATDANPGKTIGVTIANGFGLAPGDVVSVYAVNEQSVELGPASQGTVTADGTQITGATVDRVTWIVLAH